MKGVKRRSSKCIYLNLNHVQIFKITIILNVNIKKVKSEGKTQEPIAKYQVARGTTGGRAGSEGVKGEDSTGIT